tara:strand:+ start:656 stop:1048 length:393 start_codon:yes stop_codon:yes gene_type:complete
MRLPCAIRPYRETQRKYIANFVPSHSKQKVMLNFNLKPATEKRLRKILAAHSDMDAFFKNAIEYQINELKKELLNISSDLKKFEVKYKLRSEDFYSDFQAGKRGDEEDGIIWAGIYEMQMQSRKRLDELV